MRRPTTILTLCAALVTAVACQTGSGASGPTPSAVRSSDAVSPTPTPDLSADTKKVCAEIEKILDGEMKTFAEDLGEMIVYKEARNTTQANKARASAQRDLRTVATAIRTATAKALDPEVRADGVESATNIEATAASNTFFDGIKTLKDLDSLEDEMTGWLVPIATHCA